MSDILEGPCHELKIAADELHERLVEATHQFEVLMDPLRGPPHVAVYVTKDEVEALDMANKVVEDARTAWYASVKAFVLCEVAHAPRR